MTPTVEDRKLSNCISKQSCYIFNREVIVFQSRLTFAWPATWSTHSSLAAALSFWLMEFFSLQTEPWNYCFVFTVAAVHLNTSYKFPLCDSAIADWDEWPDNSPEINMSFNSRMSIQSKSKILDTQSNYNGSYLKPEICRKVTYFRHCRHCFYKEKVSQVIFLMINPF